MTSIAFWFFFFNLTAAMKREDDGHNERKSEDWKRRGLDIKNCERNPEKTWIIEMDVKVSETNPKKINENYACRNYLCKLGGLLRKKAKKWNKKSLS